LRRRPTRTFCSSIHHMPLKHLLHILTTRHLKVGTLVQMHRPIVCCCYCRWHVRTQSTNLQQIRGGTLLHLPLGVAVKSAA
jgi:hypothetical protein